MNYKIILLVSILLVIIAIEPAAAESASESSELEDIDVSSIISESLRIFADILEKSVDIVKQSAEFFDEKF